MNSKSSLGLLLMRIGVGVIFIAHGWSKLQNIAGTTAFFQGVNIPMPEVFAWVVGLVEFVGGIALVIGFSVKIVGLLLAVIMAVAILNVKWPAGGFGASEYEFVLLMVNLGFVFTGAGSNSLFGKKYMSVLGNPSGQQNQPTV
ncbi:MAG: hypothetical protein RJA61_380 [Candidatus Parcubacteria bacterium]|jgi:putative oxidoreductase